MAQLHKKFSDEQVKDLMKRYSNGEIKREHVQMVLNIGKSRFFSLLNLYRKDPLAFSVAYKRTKATRTIDLKIEKNVFKELEIAKGFIINKNMPIWSYNYSFIKNELKQRYDQEVSLQTIINKAKINGFYINKTKKVKAHDREVITNNIGELIQHDSSIHLWSPYVKNKWWLITSIDDFSRFMLFALLVLRDISLAHIRALQTEFLRYGLPLSFYVDCDSIFKFIRGRDELHYKHRLQTNEPMPQWTVAKRDKSVIASDQRERGNLFLRRQEKIACLAGRQASSLRSSPRKKITIFLRGSQRHTNGILRQSQ